MGLDVKLDPTEARVFGVLIEKSLTTPDQYPLTLNSTTLGCNQKSNRHPVVTLDDDVVDGALRRLEQRYLVRRVFPGASRVDKFVHNGKDALGLDSAALAVLAELLLRGPQPPGDLRARASRMVALDSLEQLASVLDRLIEKGYAERLAPSPGSRVERYVQLLSPGLHAAEAALPESVPTTARPAPGAVEALEARVAALEAAVEELRATVRYLSQRPAAG